MKQNEEFNFDDPKDLEMGNLAEKIGTDYKFRKHWQKEIKEHIATNNGKFHMSNILSSTLTLDIIVNILKSGYKIIKE